MARILRWWSFRRAVIVALSGVVAVSVVVGGARLWTASVAAGHVYDVGSVPKAPVAMVLGAKVYSDGEPSPFLAARLQIAQDLYETGRVRAVLVSGDNGRQEYNEVDPMRQWLTERGVPGDRVIGDYAGFDTHDSCVRAREVFGVRTMTVITQGYHIDRAVALCRRAGIEANGVADESVRRYPREWKSAALREYLANVKAGVDVVVGSEPKYLGPHESGVKDALEGQ